MILPRYKKNKLSTFLLASAVFLLSGCFLMSDIDIVEKGSEVSIFEGDYLVNSFDPTKNLDGLSDGANYSKFSTKIEKPQVNTLSLVKEGGFLSKSYSYKLDNSEIKFKELDHKNLKNIYIAQISGTLGIENKTENDLKDRPKYTFMYALLDENGNVSLYPIVQSAEDVDTFFKGRDVDLVTPEESKEMDFGFREVKGDPKAVRDSVLSFAEVSKPDLSQAILELKRMCFGKQNVWNNCVGKTENSEPEGSKVKYQEIKIGPYVDGKKMGEFYRVRTLSDGRELEMAGNYLDDEFDGAWLYKAKEGWQRSIEFDSGIAKRIKFRSKNQHFEGTIYEKDAPNLGSLKQGFVERFADKQTLVGRFTENEKGSVGNLEEGKFLYDGGIFTGTFSADGYKLVGKDHLLDDDNFYVGKFDGEAGLVLGSVKNKRCENIGRFESKKLRDGTVNHTNVEGKTVCGDKITIGTSSNLCEGQFGGPIYFENASIKFWGSTNATCKKFDYGVMVEKSTGRAFAVKSGKTDFIKLREVDLDGVMDKHNLK